MADRDQLTVRNIGQGSQIVDGAGSLEHGEVGVAQDTEHTRALIDAGHLLEMPAESKSPARASRAREE